MEQHQRPTAMLMRDPYCGHRNLISGLPDGNPTEWTAWDFAIAAAMQAIADGTTEEGHLIWEMEAEDVDVIAIKKTNKARAAIDRITDQKDYKPRPGEYFITRLIHPAHRFEPEGTEEKWQTYPEWVEKVLKEEEENPLG